MATPLVLHRATGGGKAIYQGIEQFVSLVEDIIWSSSSSDAIAYYAHHSHIL